MNYKIDNSINTEKTFVQEYLDKKEDLLNELGKYFSDEYNTEVIPIAIKKSPYGNVLNTHFLYCYKDNTIINQILDLVIDIDIDNIFKKYGFDNIEKYISNTIMPEKKSFFIKNGNTKFDVYLYAMTNDSILYSNIKSSWDIIFDYTSEIEIDYTNDNLNIIDDL